MRPKPICPAGCGGVAGGEEVIIARAGKPVARIVSIAVTAKQRPLGMDEGRYRVPADFNAPLPHDLQAAFEGSSSLEHRKSAKRRQP